MLLSTHRFFCAEIGDELVLRTDKKISQPVPIVMLMIMVVAVVDPFTATGKIVCLPGYL